MKYIILLTVCVTCMGACMGLAQAQAPGAGGANNESVPISKAEEAVFTTNHLKALKQGTRLQYQFAKRGNLEAVVNDTATVNIKKNVNDGHEVEVQCLSGERKVDLPMEGEIKGNPIIMCFLERDIREMKRITGGSVSYYRKRIRMALAEDAVIKATTASVNGKQVAATEIFIDPYKKDEARVRFAKFANKSYRFVLSDAVPGGVLELQSLMHEEGKPDAVMVEEKFSYKKS